VTVTGALALSAAPAASSAVTPGAGAATTAERAAPHTAKTPISKGTGGAVTSVDPEATRIGIRVLRRGGNAVDAAVATAAALGVTEPYSAGIGGGGYFVHYNARNGKVRVIDGRETAPESMPRTAFQDEEGVTRSFNNLVTSGVSIGVPGTLATWETALERWGTRSLGRLLRPAARLADRGFVVDETYALQTSENQQRFRAFTTTPEVFLPGGQLPEVGSLFRNPDLARTYRTLGRRGAGWFYGGALGREITAVVQSPPKSPDTGFPVPAGYMRPRDLAEYETIVRRPTKVTYRGHQVYGMPPSSSGGTTVGEALNILEGFSPLGDTLTTTHRYLEASKLAFADRGAYLGDPDQVRVPLAALISKEYATLRRGEIDPNRAKTFRAGTFSLAPAARAAGAVETNPNGSTTHVSVSDRRGNAVALTCTIEQEFGSAVMAPGTGFILNNELTDFGDPGTANAPAPGKRPRSSMAPTIVAQGGRPVLVAGGAGGARIIMGVLLQVVNTVDYGLSLAQSVDAERLDNQGGATINIEEARVDPAQLQALVARGHRLTREGEYGPRPRVQLAGVDRRTGRRTAVSDSRSDRGSLVERARR
jgi:gamma-glutamyltranspeptidase / glutathione hydrolase